jgi:hypothetical protein
MSKQQNLVTFIDHIGRTIVGEQVSSTKDSIKVKNPAIIHVAQNNQTGQIQVQTLPLFFREFINPDKHNEGTVWEFAKDKIIPGEVDLDPRLTSQYEKIFAPIDASAVVAAPRVANNTARKESKDGSAEVIKLFDE